MASVAVNVPVTSDGRHSCARWHIAKRLQMVYGAASSNMYTIHILFIGKIIENKINPYHIGLAQHLSILDLSTACYNILDPVNLIIIQNLSEQSHAVFRNPF